MPSEIKNFEHSFSMYKNHNLIEKISRSFDNEYFTSILKFCTEGEHILMYNLVDKFVNTLFKQVDANIEDNLNAVKAMEPQFEEDETEESAETAMQAGKEDKDIFEKIWEDTKLRNNIKALVRLSLNRESHVNMV